MAVINTNITSLIGQQNLNKSQSSLQTAMERLSSGSRINSAKDDAAGQAIANRMSAQITGLSTAQRNANDGISIAQTAEGGLNQINDNLQRIRELTVQAQNGTNSASDIDSIQQEVNQRLEEINRIAQETDFNGSKILSKGQDDTISIQVGSQDGQQIDIKINANTGWNKFTESGEGFVAKANMELVNGEARNVDAKGFDVLSAAAGTTDTTVNISSGTITNGDTTSYVTDSSNNDQLYIKNETNVAATVKGSTTGITNGGAALTNAAIVTNDAGEAYAVLDTTVASSENGTTENFIRIEDSMLDENGNVTLDASKILAADKFTFSEITSEFTKNTPTDAAGIGTNHSVASGGSAPALVATTEYYAVTDKMVDDTGALTANLSTLESVELDETTLTAKNADGTYAVGNTNTPLKALDDALQAVDVQRSELGAIQNRFESAITNLSTNETNLSAARSRIEDADYAVEVANMTRAQILQQAGTSVLAQANQIPQGVLSLLG